MPWAVLLKNLVPFIGYFPIYGWRQSLENIAEGQ